MAASLQAFTLIPFLVTVVAGGGTCPAGASCTTVGDEVNATLHLMQIGFSMQPGTAGPGPAPEPAAAPAPKPAAAAAPSNATDDTNECKKGTGDPGQTRVWYACMGGKTPAPTGDQGVSGVQVGSQMCCTEEVGFACLCCMDFTKPLPFKRCGSMSLSAAQKKRGDPGALTSDVPDANSSVSLTEAEKTAVVICTEDRPMGPTPKQGSVALPVQCIPKEFTLAELQGSGGDKGNATEPGQILFDQRILFLMQQGLPSEAIPTCKGTINGTCPDGTPKAGQKPNSAGEDTLAKLNLLASRAAVDYNNDFAGLGGALMTSGSFTMMSSGGGD